jgi:IS30 family transposase
MAIDYYTKVEAFERRVISEALQEACGNQAQAARQLGLAPTTLSSQLRRLGIQVREFKRSSTSESFETFQRFLLWKSGIPRASSENP